MSKKILIIFIIVIIFLSYQVGVFFGREAVLKTPPPQLVNVEGETDFSLFWEAWRKLERDFLEKDRIDYQEMIYGAIRGMTNSLQDPYTTFFNPEEAEEFEQELSGRYEGVGMEVAMRDNIITVVSPLEGTPAFHAGIKPGDKILKINDLSTKDMLLEEAVSLIRGEEGTTVTLLIDRVSWDTPRPIALQRNVIKIPTLKVEIRDDISIIRIYQFNSILLKEFAEASDDIFSTKKLVLDLRNNPGGYLDVAQKMAGWFLEKGDIVAWEDSSKEERKSYKAPGPSALSKYPMVVLINEGSASGAEILAGALRDNRGVKLIGQKSFGKGSVQEQIFLSGGSSMKITIAKWLTPNGHSINEQGLVPDIEVQESLEDDVDLQLERALEVLNNL